MTKVDSITVNTEHSEYQYNDFPAHREVQAAIDEAAKQHPSWTSMVVIVTNR